MEQRIKPLYGGHNGYMLITVLIITAIGLLFGAGALLLFKFQCQLRIDGQHELEKVYAVRSVLNYITKNANNIKSEGTTFEFFTKSERNLKVIAKPVKRIFPDFNNVNHLDIANEGKNGRVFVHKTSQINSDLDYEYGASGVTNVNEGITSVIGEYGLKFSDVLATNTVKWWVNIGMRNTGGWLQEEYGRRYYFEPQSYVGGQEKDAKKDTIRLCIVRDITNSSQPVGRTLGWPLSQEGERAIVFQVNQKDGVQNLDGNTRMTLSEWVYTNNVIAINEIINWEDKDMPAITAYMGVQLASDNVTLFYSQKGVDTEGTTNIKAKVAYVFSPGESKLTRKTYEYFANEIKLGNCKYPGVQTNDNRVIAPDLRAVFEVEATGSKRPYIKDSDSNNTSGSNNYNFLTHFGVVPAYQFDILIEHPENITNLATVAQRIMTAKGQGRNGTQYAVRTYDTHGTENKGFRKDEKLARENKGRTQ